jgi:hypothetical protein
MISPIHRGHADATFDLQLSYISNRIVGGTTELSEQATVEAEIDPQPLGFFEYPLSVRGCRQHLIFSRWASKNACFLSQEGQYDR